MNENHENKNGGYYASLSGFRRAVPIILIAVGVFFSLCFITDFTGVFGKVFADGLLGLFSVGAYTVPVLIILHGIFYPADHFKKRVLSRFVFSVITPIAVSVIAYAVYHLNLDVKPGFMPESYYEMGIELHGGGVIGSIIAFGIIKIFGAVGLIIITSTVLALYLAYFFADGRGGIARVSLGLLSFFANIGALVERGVKKLFGSVKNAKDEKNRRISEKTSRNLSEDDFFMVDNGMQSFEISGLGIKETRTKESVEENPTLHNKVHVKSHVEGDPDDELFEDGHIVEPEDEPEKEPPRKRKFFHADIDLDDKVQPEDESPEDDIIIDEPDRKRFYKEDSAENVFAKDFDPFDLSANEKLASKPSSKASSVRTEKKQNKTFTEDISGITAEDVEKARRQAEFEMKKRTIMENFRKEESKANESEMSTEDYIYSTAAAKEAPKFDSYAPRAEEAPKFDSYAPRTEEAPKFDSYAPRTEEAPKFDSYAPRTEETPVFGSSSSGYSDEREAEARREPPKTDYERVARFSSVITEYVTEEKKEPERTVIDTYEPPVAEPVTTVSEPEEKDEPVITLEREIVIPEIEDEEDEVPYDIEQGDFESGVPDEVAAEESADDPVIIPEEERNPKVAEYRSMFPALDEDDGEEEEPAPGLVFERDESAFIPEPEDEEEELVTEDESDDEPPFDVEPECEPEDTVIPEPEPEPEPPKPKKPDYSNYKYPPITILAPEDDMENDDIQAEIEDNANKLISTLESFRVKASIKGVDRGPRITRYEIVPATGVKVSSVMSLQNDIALNLAAEGIRMEAPIPGKSAIGFEIPNRKPSTVRLRALLETEEFVASKSKTTVCIGKDVAGCPVFGDIAKMPHVLIAGATGMGKSVCINSILISMLYKAKPDEVKFIMIDPKKVEFTMYNGIPHLLIPVVTDPKQAAGALMWAVEQMEKRYEMIEKMRVRNIEMYNDKVAKDPSLGEPMSKIVVVIDELNDLMLQVRDPVEGLIMSIAQKARAAGIHLIIGTQRPSVDVITGVIKANIPSRIACKVMSNTDSRTILDQKGAEDLLDKGDMLFFPAGKPKPARVQGAFVSDGEVEEIMEFLKSQGGDGENYDNDVMEEIQRNAQKCNKKSSDDFDDDGDDEDDGIGYLSDQKFLDAVNVAVTTGKISTSLLQRKLSIGYGKAAKYVDIMEDMGIVSESNGQKARDVLMTRDEWHEKLARLSLDD